MHVSRLRNPQLPKKNTKIKNTSFPQNCDLPITKKTIFNFTCKNITFKFILLYVCAMNPKQHPHDQHSLHKEQLAHVTLTDLIHKTVPKILILVPKQDSFHMQSTGPTREHEQPLATQVAGRSAGRCLFQSVSQSHMLSFPPHPIVARYEKSTLTPLPESEDCGS